MAKYIFVTGGVVSGLGKGITAASLGRLLKARGLKVAAQKLDPYINVDPGTMSPYQHGEVFVTEDGAETDLDLGHYERFIDEDLNKLSNLTSGRVYWNVLQKERRGEYLGETVQVIPHITSEIKSFIYGLADKTHADVVITEIGGTVGDIESQPFIEAIRQITHEVGFGRSMLIHVTLVPFLRGSDEHKSKPTQHSVKELQGMGLRPQVIVCRSDEKIEPSVLKKIAQFCNVEKDCVIENTTLPSLYMCPTMLEEHGLANVVIRELDLECHEPDNKSWNDMVERIKNLHKTVKIALVGKYVKLHDAYLSVMEALNHAGFELGAKVQIKWVESEGITAENVRELLGDCAGIIVPGGFGSRGVNGMVEACRFARENDIPYFGICLGMQVSVIEYARNVLGFNDAHSTEFEPHTEHPVIALMEDQHGVQAGGTMRLGAYPCVVKDGTKMKEAYGVNEISERHRHRYEFNNAFKQTMIDNGLTICGTSPGEKLVEAVEVTKNKFHLAVQFHPEFKSRPNRAHPLFFKFIEASLANSTQ